MRIGRWIGAFTVAAFVFAGANGFAQGHGRGHDKDKHEAKHEAKHEVRYSAHDREAVQSWYHDHRGHLPPGLAKRDELPPGLERQLRVRGALPPGLQKKVQPCPVTLVRYLPPAPPDCAHVIIGGNIVLLNRHTSVVLDIMRIEL